MFSFLRLLPYFLVSLAYLVSLSTLAQGTKDVSEVNKETRQIQIEVERDRGLPVEIVVPVVFFMTFPACMLLFFLFKYRSNREKQITLRIMVENGAQIPPEMFMEGKKQINPIERDRKVGLLFTLGSIGIIAFLLIFDTGIKGIWSIGLIPLLIGLGYIVNWDTALSSEGKS